MEGLKWLGCGLLLSCGILLGLLLNRRAGGVLSRLEAYLELLRLAKLQVSCFSLPVGDILRRADPGLLYRCGWTAEEPPGDFSELTARCPVGDPRCDRLLLSFAEGFGRGYREEQLRECDGYIDPLEDRRAQLREGLGGRKRIHATLCVSGALALIILLV